MTIPLPVRPSYTVLRLSEERFAGSHFRAILPWLRLPAGRQVIMCRQLIQIYMFRSFSWLDEKDTIIVFKGLESATFNTLDFGVIKNNLRYRLAYVNTFSSFNAVILAQLDQAGVD